MISTVAAISTSARTMAVPPVPVCNVTSFVKRMKVEG
jgi:hypothetical protein